MLPALIQLLMVLAVLLSVPVLALYKSKLEVDSVDDCRRPEDLAVASALGLLLPVILVVTHFGTRYFQSTLRYWFSDGGRHPCGNAP